MLELELSWNAEESNLVKKIGDLKLKLSYNYSWRSCSPHHLIELVVSTTTAVPTAGFNIFSTSWAVKSGLVLSRIQQAEALHGAHHLVFVNFGANFRSPIHGRNKSIIFEKNILDFSVSVWLHESFNSMNKKRKKCSGLKPDRTWSPYKIRIKTSHVVFFHLQNPPLKLSDLKTLLVDKTKTNHWEAWLDFFSSKDLGLTSPLSPLPSWPSSKYKGLLVGILESPSLYNPRHPNTFYGLVWLDTKNISKHQTSGGITRCLR